MSHRDRFEFKIETADVTQQGQIMSVAEIIQEIPRLSLAERRVLTNKLLELEPGREILETCDQVGDESLQILDRMEEDDGRCVQG